MNLQTNYLGLALKNPLVAAASPLTDNLDNLKAMEDNGIAAVVLPSLFEEQLTHDMYEHLHHTMAGTDSFPEASKFFPEPKTFKFGPESYLDHIRKAKAALRIPVIASLNGHGSGGWVTHAKLMEGAGADAIELNIYHLPTHKGMKGASVESRYLDIVRAVKAEVKIPVAVKIPPFFSSIANMASLFAQEGANGLVLFNRFYQPDINIETLEVEPSVVLSSPTAIRLPLLWIALLYGNVPLNMAASSGIHSASDVLKCTMAGADVSMLCSVLYKQGLPFIARLISDLNSWMESHEYESIAQMKGSMSYKKADRPEAYERANYVRSMRNDFFMIRPMPFQK